MDSPDPVQGVLAIDAGQTGIKVRVSGIGAGSRDQVFPGILTHQPLLPQLAELTRTVLDGSGLTNAVVAAGVSGLTSIEADAAALLAGIADPRVRDVRLAHDSTTSYLGALGYGSGAVVASGTGVVTLAVGSDRVARVDGWGHIMGDAGSGYWIGREALDAVMRAYDGRGPHTALRGVAEDRWPDLSRAYIDLQSADDRVSIVASFAAHVARLADEGDAVALLISTRAGTELARSVETALRVVGADTSATEVCAMGGVMRSATVQEAFTAHVSAQLPHARIVAPRGAGIDGAAAIAALPRAASALPLGLDRPPLAVAEPARRECADDGFSTPDSVVRARSASAATRERRMPRPPGSGAGASGSCDRTPGVRRATRAKPRAAWRSGHRRR